MFAPLSRAGQRGLGSGYIFLPGDLGFVNTRRRNRSEPERNLE
jgi:hypothetical protein